VGPLGVVAPEPVGGDGADLGERREDVRVQDFGPVRLVEAFDEGARRAQAEGL
jgi:hypothetical protein